MTRFILSMLEWFGCEGTIMGGAVGISGGVYVDEDILSLDRSSPVVPTTRKGAGRDRQPRVPPDRVEE